VLSVFTESIAAVTPELTLEIKLVMHGNLVNSNSVYRFVQSANIKFAVLIPSHAVHEMVRRSLNLPRGNWIGSSTWSGARR